MKQPSVIEDITSHHFEVTRIVARSRDDRDALLAMLEKEGWFKSHSPPLPRHESLNHSTSPTPVALPVIPASMQLLPETVLTITSEPLVTEQWASCGEMTGDAQPTETTANAIKPVVEPTPEDCSSEEKAENIPKSSEYFSVLAKAYVDNKLRSAKTPGQRESAFDAYRSFTLFLRIVGDKRVDAISTTDVSKFADALQRWPKGGVDKPCYEGKDAKGIIRYAERNKLETLGLATQRKHILYLDVLFNDALNCKHTRSGPMRLLDMGRYEEKIPRKKKNFSKKNIETVFDASLLATIKDPLMYWGPLIAMYTSMRCQEVAQLYTDNIERVEMLDENDNPVEILCIDISPDEKGQSLKSPYARRLLPVHSKLIKAGFEKYVEDIRKYGSPYLFPCQNWSGYKRKKQLSGWFNGERLREVCGIDNKRITLHCFRHTLTTMADRSNVPKGVVVSINGHSDGRGVDERFYRQRADALECRDALEKLPFPELNLPVYVSGRFDSYLNTLKASEESLQRRIAEGIPLPKKRGRPSKDPERLCGEGPWKESQVGQQVKIDEE